MKRKQYNQNIITVMADHGGAFLWQQSCDCGVAGTCVGPCIADCFSNTVNWPDGWRIPKSLEHRFVRWQLYFERYSLNRPGFNWDTHFRKEEALVDELQEILGWQKYIVRPSPHNLRILTKFHP